MTKNLFYRRIQLERSRLVKLHIFALQYHTLYSNKTGTDKTAVVK